MNIFMGSSREALQMVDWLANCLQEYGHKPIRWDDPGLFPPGCNTFLQLIEISKTVDAAIFVFSMDDKVWYRGDTTAQPRDNVLIEYGLFAGALGPHKAIMCVHEKPKTAADLAGITYVDVSEQRSNRARLEIRAWLNNLTSKKIDQATLQLLAKLNEQENARQALEQELQFERDKSEDLEEMLAQKGGMDLRPSKLQPDDYWSLLYEFDFFWAVSLEMASLYKTPSQLAREIPFGKGGIQFAPFLSDADHTTFFARKVLRNVRRNLGVSSFHHWIETLPSDSLKRVQTTAMSVKSKKLITDGSQ
jgi:hypothetical protein